MRSLEVPIQGLPSRLSGLRIVHLSDLHLGVPSRAVAAAERAVAWTVERNPDLVCITGDLLSRPRGQAVLHRLLAPLRGSFAVLGNHDFGVTRDPFAKPAELFDASPARILADSAVTVERRGARIQVAGVDPRTFMAGRFGTNELADQGADLRVLLCHFPMVIDRLRPRAFHLVLAGDLHDGQIAVPFRRGKLRLGGPRFPYPSGLYARPAAVLHVSPGLGTSFVPLRFCARPEVTELVLRPELPSRA